jgi:O-acetyl-ADP-ribose deacetylase (regulator of RNase III)
MFKIDTDVYVNTVNCVGVMGKGVALAFKKRFPEMFREYKKECEKGNIKIGKLHIYYTECKILNLERKIIINFPTKIHWKTKSKYEYIELGLIELRKFLKELGCVKIALPALGCGHGKLNWNKVKSMINKYLSEIDATIYVFQPSDSRKIK